MKAQLRGHFRGRPAAVEPQLHSVLLERSIKLLTDLLRFDHRLIHSLIVFHGLSLPVSAKSLQPQSPIRGTTGRLPGYERGRGDGPEGGPYPWEGPGGW